MGPYRGPRARRGMRAGHPRARHPLGCRFAYLAELGVNLTAAAREGLGGARSRYGVAEARCGAVERAARAPEHACGAPQCQAHPWAKDSGLLRSPELGAAL